MLREDVDGEELADPSDGEPCFSTRLQGRPLLPDSRQIGEMPADAVVTPEQAESILGDVHLDDRGVCLALDGIINISNRFRSAASGLACAATALARAATPILIYAFCQTPPKR